jgi:DNA-binding transcriptional regulator YhcF (GntR family)
MVVINNVKNLVDMGKNVNGDKDGNKNSTGIVVLTDATADTTGIFAKMPLFNKGRVDLTPGESVLLSWFAVSKFEGYGINRKILDVDNRIKTSMSEIMAAVGTTRKVVRRNIQSLVDKKLIELDYMGNETRITYDLSVTKEFRMVTKALIVTDMFSFKLKGFIISLLLTARNYVIEFDSIKHMSEIVGMNRRTVKKYYEELKDLGFVIDIDGRSVIDIREMFIAAIDKNADEIVQLRKELEKEKIVNATLLEKLKKLDEKVDKLIDNK